MENDYVKTMLLIERINNKFLDNIKDELYYMGIKDINNVQAFLLYKIGKDEISIGDIYKKGYYLGSNVSYNLSSVLRNGYFIKDIDKYDKRIKHIHMSEKGRLLYDRLETIFLNSLIELKNKGIMQASIKESHEFLREIEALLMKMPRRLV